MSRRACICIHTVRMTGHDGIWLYAKEGAAMGSLTFGHRMKNKFERLFVLAILCWERDNRPLCDRRSCIRELFYSFSPVISKKQRSQNGGLK